MHSDFPRAIQQTFIIYSRLQRAGDSSLIIPSAPMIWQAASFVSETGFAAVSGSFTSDAVDITPVLTDGALSFEVLGNAHGVYHSGTFTLTLTTVGDAEAGIEPASATFTIQVVVFGKADLLGANRTRTYYVGDRVEPFSIAPSPLNPVIDYGATVSGSLKDITNQYDSGLTVTHVQDPIQYKTVDIKLGGKATRPGVYLIWVFVNCWTEGGQFDNLPGTFDRGNNAVPLVITILDDDHAEGNLMVAASANISGPASHYRVVWMSEAIQAIASAEHLYNCEMYQQESGDWLGAYVEDRGEYTLTYQYRLRYDAGSWNLEGREIDSRSAAPDFELYESSTERISGQDVPHVHGWLNVGIQGLTEFALWARETADDPWELFGFFDHLAPGVYEQQTMYCPQYEGLVTGPSRLFDSGFIYSENEGVEGDFADFLIKKEYISTVVTPYAPPATERYTYTTIPEEGEPKTLTVPIRDVAVAVPVKVLKDGKTVTMKAPHSLNGQREDGLTVPGGKRWKFWPGARRIVPLNGTAGDYVSLPAISVTYEAVTRSSNRRHEEYHNQAGSMLDEVINTTEEDTSTTSFSGSIPGGGQQRDRDTILLSLGATDTGAGTYSASSSWRKASQSSNPYGSSSDDREVTETEEGTVNNAYGSFAVYVASGPFTGLCKHQAIAVEMGTFSAGGNTVKNRHEDINGVVTDTPSEGTFGAKASFYSDRPVVIVDDGLAVDYEYEHVEESVSGTVRYGYNDFFDTYSESGGGVFEATHSRTTVNGATTGTTTVIYTPTGGEPTETTSDDPDGSIYALALENFGQGTEIPPPSWTGPAAEIETAVDIGWTESYSRQKFSFKV